ncbi:MAG: FAD-dependent oxidoreductase [Anaerolineaceae bacterium]|nr:FAD-dependent oxidoreductase [Anaerolineaceae bacterium]
MTKIEQNPHLVAVIGAGPAGLYAAQALAKAGAQVVLFNRDIKPGGLAEYGIFPDKYKMRLGLSHQFNRILDHPNVHYLGNIAIGQLGDLKLDQLRSAGFQAFMVTIGAQKNNWLGLPGEDLEGVYQANDIVYHYTQHPEMADWQPSIGKQVGIIGMGNVMLDIVHYLKQQQETRNVTAFARRGPTEVKFDKQTLEPVASCLDLAEIRAAVDEAIPQTNKVGGDVEKFYELLAQARERAEECDSGIDFGMKFLRSPRRLLGDEQGRVKAAVFEVNQLVRDGDRIKSVGTGQLETVSLDTVIFSIGSRVSDRFGLPVAHGHFVTTPDPRYPVDGISYEVYNPDLCIECDDIFVSGWARVPGEGIVGLARKDAERGAKAVLAYLDTLPASTRAVEQALEELPPVNDRLVDLDDLKKLEAVEQKKADERGLPAFKFSTREEMLKAIDQG